MYEEIMGQVRSHIHDLRDRIEEVQDAGCLKTSIRRGPFILVGSRKGHFLYDQLVFAGDELRRWKAWAERDSRGPN